MSDLSAQYKEGAFELDEDTLINALRNQDDIPILMDIVAEQTGSLMSQDEYLVRSFDPVLNSSQEGNSQQTTSMISSETTPSEISLNERTSSQVLIAKTIAEVLERRLPELVAEVVELINLGARKNNH